MRKLQFTVQKLKIAQRNKYYIDKLRKDFLTDDRISKIGYEILKYFDSRELGFKSLKINSLNAMCDFADEIKTLDLQLS